MPNGPGNRQEAPRQTVYTPSFLEVRQGKIDVPKPPAILAEEQRLGGKQLEPVYAKGDAGGGRGGGNIVEYGPPIGYRYDNGQSQYVNFDATGQYQGTADRQNLGTLIKDLAPLALAALGANFLVPMLSGAAGGAGLLGAEGATAALGAGQVAAAAPLAFTPEMIAAGAFTPGSIGAAGAASGALTGEALAAAGGLVTQGATPALVEMATQGAQNYLESGGGAQAGAGGGPNGTDIFRETSVNQGVASGLGPGSMGAEMAATGGLTAEQLAAAAGTTGAGTGLLSSASSSLPSLETVKNALTIGSIAAGALGNKDEPAAPTFTMAPYVPPSGKPFANLGMSPIATPYTPTRILGQYDPTMTPGGVSPYELIMAQMQAPKNLYADFEAGTNIGGYDPQKFVIPPAAAAAAPPNNMGGMIDKSRMVGPNPMGPDNGFASIQDGEFVMNRKATQKYGIELMNAINSGKISKGNLSGLLQA